VGSKNHHSKVDVVTGMKGGSWKEGADFAVSNPLISLKEREEEKHPDLIWGSRRGQNSTERVKGLKTPDL